jgi:hypothetical protein
MLAFDSFTWCLKTKGAVVTEVLYLFPGACATSFDLLTEDCVWNLSVSFALPFIFVKHRMFV